MWTSGSHGNSAKPRACPDAECQNPLFTYHTYYDPHSYPDTQPYLHTHLFADQHRRPNADGHAHTNTDIHKDSNGNGNRHCHPAPYLDSHPDTSCPYPNSLAYVNTRSYRRFSTGLLAVVAAGAKQWL
jgi:hypothetical protein